jgi:hypothetical protein
MKLLWPQKKIKCILKEKLLSIGQGDSGEQCGPWASCLFFLKLLLFVLRITSRTDQWM